MLPGRRPARDGGRPQRRRGRRGHWSRRGRGRRFFASPCRRTSRQALCDPAAAGRRIPDRERAGRRPAAIGTGSDPATCLRASNSRRRQGSARARRRAQRCADLRRLRAQARRVGEGVAGSAALRQRRLVVVFGAGGDRDAGSARSWARSRPRNADRVIVTDDNPRSEKPEAIRAEILATGKGAPRNRRPCRGDPHRDRGIAKTAMRCSIAGKGHETGQIVGGEVLPFSDHEAVAAALASRDCMSGQSWTVAEVARALGAAGSFPDTPIDFVTQDSRLVKPGCLFVALQRYAERRLYLGLRQRARRLGVRGQGGSVGRGRDDRAA